MLTVTCQSKIKGRDGCSKLQPCSTLTKLSLENQPCTTSTTLYQPWKWYLQFYCTFQQQPAISLWMKQLIVLTFKGLVVEIQSSVPSHTLMQTVPVCVFTVRVWFCPIVNKVYELLTDPRVLFFQETLQSASFYSFICITADLISSSVGRQSCPGHRGFRLRWFTSG